MEYVKKLMDDADATAQKLTDLIAHWFIMRIKEDIPPEMIDGDELVFVFKGFPEETLRSFLRFSFDDEVFITKVIKQFPEIKEEFDIQASYSVIQFIYTDEFRSEVKDAAVMIHIPLLMERVGWDSSQITGDENESAVTTSMSINVQTDKDGTLGSLLAARVSSTYTS